MSEVNIYDFDSYEYDQKGFKKIECNDGNYVEYSDYKNLNEKLSAQIIDQYNQITELKSLMSVQLDMKAKIEELETQLASPEIMSRGLHESRMDAQEHYYIKKAIKQDAIISELKEALNFECGNRCADQNPCNAKEVLKKLAEWRKG